MPRKLKAIRFWQELSLPALLHLGAAGFLIFSSLGLISVLIESSIRFFPWSFVIIQAVAAGGLPACIILFGRRRWWITFLFILFWNGVMILNGGGISFMYTAEEGFRVRLGEGIREHPPSILRNSGIVLTPAKLDAVYLQRGIIGIATVTVLVTGYILFMSVIRGEIRRRSRLETEVRIAKEIQQSLLPVVPFNFPSGAISGITLPAGEVGGDYYDIIPLVDGRLALAIADVTGHGVGAGILSAMTKSALHLQLNHESDPESVLNRLNRVLYEVSDEKTFVTFAYALIDPINFTMSMATAGHPPGLYRAGATRVVTPLRSKNVALGMRKDVAFSGAMSVRYSPGDVLLLYTDGLLEAANTSGDQFNERLQEVLARADGTPQDIVDAILTKLREFAGRPEGFEDDISLVCVQFKGGASP